jgi:alkylation response protein AidB-like acyl-CoA dehydrogenase
MEGNFEIGRSDGNATSISFPHSFLAAPGSVESVQLVRRSNGLRIADMRGRVQTARFFLHEAAALLGAGKSIPMEAAMAKLAISEAFVENSLAAIRIHGGTGYLTGTGVERDLRDAVGGVIYSGTSDIQRNLIARLLGL